MEPVIVIHGGAGDIADARVAATMNAIKRAACEGYRALIETNDALNAVETAVRYMEKDENFNAGYGSVLNSEGNVELDASIMHGKDLKAGCVTLLQGIMHPVSVARRIMEKTNHVFLGGCGAMSFACKQLFKILPEGALVTERARRAFEQAKYNKMEGCDELKVNKGNGCDELKGNKKEGCVPPFNNRKPAIPGTVGAVAIDAKGNIAAATSTGGIAGKLPGRIGDTPILGSGTYADNEIGGVSATGDGEIIMRFNLASKILQRIKYEKASAQTATECAVKEMTKRLPGTGGAITIDKNGNIGIYFNTKRMAWAYVKAKELHFGINHCGKYGQEDCNKN